MAGEASRLCDDHPTALEFGQVLAAGAAYGRRWFDHQFGRMAGKLLVKAGQSVQLTATAKVSGAITVKPGGALDVEGTTLSGSVSAKGVTLVGSATPTSVGP